MIDRKLLVNALRINNEDVLPKFGDPDLRKVMEASTEYVHIDDIIDFDNGSITHDGALSILDMLERGSAGVSDMDNQPVLTFMKNGAEIYAHNLNTDEDDIIDANPEALSEYIQDQMVASETFAPEDATTEATNVIFLREPNEYTEETDILAVFPDEVEQAGAEGRVLCYSHVGQHSYADPFYIDDLEEATPEEYEPLKKELEGQGYVLNVLNGLQQESAHESLGKSLSDLPDYSEQELIDFVKEFSAENAIDFNDPMDVAYLADKVSDVFSVDCTENELLSWLKAHNADSINEEYTDVDAQVEDIENRIKSTASNVRNILITAYRNDEEKGMKDLPEIYSLVESKMEELVEDIKDTFALSSLEDDEEE